MTLKRLSGLFLAGMLTFWGCSGENTASYTLEDTNLRITDVIGPVSQYGELVAGAVDGKGGIYGSCKGVKAGEEVQVRGMSLFWSVTREASPFYTEAAIASMVRDMKIQVIRAAIGTEENWGVPGYMKDPESQETLIKQVVEGAIKNDIYVIIDWHSHTATDQLDAAKEFFGKMAEQYGQYNNVIFEIFNEPKNQPWEQIKDYANQVIAVIRQYSNNLVLVGNPSWDQKPHVAIDNEVEDPANNVAYTFHYYANTHKVSYEGANAVKAINAGLSIFVSEWGTVDASGDGTPNEAKNQQWQDWVNENKLSAANWSATVKNEGASAFTPGSRNDSLAFTVSGEMVKSYLSTNPDSYTICKSEK